MQVELLSEEVPLALIVFVLQQLHCLSQIAIDILNLPLTVSVVYCHLDLDGLVRVIKNLVNFGEKVHVVLWAEAVKASSALDVALEIKILCGQTLDRLLLDLLLFT